MEARLRLSAVALVAMLWSLCAAVGMAHAAPVAATTIQQRLSEIKDRMIADPVGTIADAQSLVAATRQGPDATPVQRAEALWLLGEAQARTGDRADALGTLREARSVAEADARARSGLVHANILLSLGDVETDSGEITRALPTLQAAHSEFLRLGDSRSRAKALISIALLYNRARDFTATLRYFQQASAAYSRDPRLNFAIHNGQGLALSEFHRWHEAEQQFTTAASIAAELHSAPILAAILGNLAVSQLQQQRIQQAHQTVTRGLSLKGLSATDRLWLIAVAARIAERQGRTSEAERLIAQRFAGVDLDTTALPDRDAHETAYRIYRATGQQDRALAHLAALKRLDDQATAIARSSSAALAGARFDYANQELRIAKLQAADLQKSVALERSAARTQRMIFIVAGAATLLVIVLLGVGLFTIRRSRNQVRAANADLATSNTALERALAAKTEFLATTSHEIRTPLNGILGMTQVMIADRELDGDTRARLEVVHGAGTTMRALVDDLLDMAKIESGRMTVEEASFSPAACLRDAGRLWEDQARAKGLTFRVALDDCPRTIVGDEARLRQIVFNLLSNAVKFTPTGMVELRTAIGEGRWQVTVRDSGVGIPAEVREAIFEAFRQGDSGVTRQFGGTGLGLAICRNLARAMAGDVSVESVAGEGSTFTLDLPLAEGDAAVAEPCALLLIDANPISRATLLAMFESALAAEGQVAAGDADAAATLARERAPARILLDGGSASLLPDLRRLCPKARFFVLQAPGVATAVDGADTINRPIARAALIERVRSRHPALAHEAA